MSPRRGAGEDGFTAAELALGLGLLLFPVAMLVLTLPTWSERQTTARAIAHEVAREVAREGVCDTAAATGLGTIMARNLGLPAGDATVALDCAAGEPLPRGGSVEAAVTVAIPAVHLPGFGDVAAWSWTARHREPIDQYGSIP